MKLFSDKKRFDDETIQCTHHVENCIHACTLYAFMYVRDITHCKYLGVIVSKHNVITL